MKEDYIVILVWQYNVAMESCLGIKATGVFNPITFAGAGFLLSRLNHGGYEKEIKRHNEAMGKLSKAKDKWYEEQVKKKDKIEMLRQQASDANAGISDTNHALEKLRKITRQPKLEDYYKPLDEMKEYQLVFVSLMGFGGGRVLYKII